jgi:uncharacterized protein
MQKNQQYYNSYTDFLRNKFGVRVQKLSVNAGLNCPNRDGTKGEGGCIYCLNEAFTPSYCKAEKSVTEQLSEGMHFHKNRYRRADSYIAYFQSFSNTYTSPEILSAMLHEAVEFPDIKGITIGTRPDCIDNTTADVLAFFSEKIFLKVELGIESVYDKTLKLINRGHSFDDVQNAILILQERNIPSGGHFILGLPGETREQILDSANVISHLGLFSLKLHQLQILKNTRLELLYRDQPDFVQLFEPAEYIDFVVSFSELLNPDIRIERFAAEVPPRFLIAPDWGMIRYDQILQKIIMRFEERNTFQGRLYKQ